MTDLTEATAVTAEDLKNWYELQAELTRVKAAEAMLRSRIYKHFFPQAAAGEDGTEGTNTVDLNDGTGAVIKAQRKVERKVLEPELDAYKAALKEEGSNLPKLPLNKLLKYKPELSVSEYRKLTAEEQKVCDTFLNIKDGSPQVEITIPKRAARS